MKLYPDKMKISNIDNKKINKLEPYKQKQYINNTFYSREGIFKYFNNQLYQLYPVDYDSFSIKLQKENIIVDKSYLKKTNIHYQIPYDYFLDSVEETQFKISSKSNLTLIIEKKNKIIENIYLTCFDYKKIDENELDIFFKILF